MPLKENLVGRLTKHHRHLHDVFNILDVWSRSIIIQMWPEPPSFCTTDNYIAPWLILSYKSMEKVYTLRTVISSYIWLYYKIGVMLFFFALTLTIAHSLALILMRLWLRSSAYNAPIREPMEVPPMRSTGMPASQRARNTPTWEQPLDRRMEKQKIFMMILSD